MESTIAINSYSIFLQHRNVEFVSNKAKYFIRLSEQREVNFFKGINTLELWISEIYTKGIQLLHNHPQKIEEISKILVDFGLAGLARKIRLIPEQLENDSGNTDRLYSLFSELSLFIKLCTKIEDLSDEKREDLLMYAGIPFKKSTLPDLYAFTDDWFCLGKVREREENLLVVRQWFYGMQSKRIIMFLEFLFGRFAREKEYLPGAVYNAPVTLYPSAYPIRAAYLNRDARISISLDQINSISLHEMLNEYCKLILLNPFTKQMMYLIREFQLAHKENIWYAQSSKGELIHLNNPIEHIATMVIYINQPGSIFCGEFAGRSLKVVSILHGQSLICLS